MTPDFQLVAQVVGRAIDRDGDVLATAHEVLSSIPGFNAVAFFKAVTAVAKEDKAVRLLAKRRHV